MNILCLSCDKRLTPEEYKSLRRTCNDCNINETIQNLAHHMREARITFEEMIRKLITEIDK